MWRWAVTLLEVLVYIKSGEQQRQGYIKRVQAGLLHSRSPCANRTPLRNWRGVGRAYSQAD